MQTILLCSLVVLVTYTVEAITGFGGTVMALPFVIALLGLKQGVTALTFLSIFVSTVLVIKNFRHISWRNFLVIVLFMAPGLFLGRHLQTVMDQRVLKTILAVFILLLSSFKLVTFLVRNKKAQKQKEPIADHSENKATVINTEVQSTEKGGAKWYSYMALALAGVIHGMFSCGGPLAIIYATSTIREKNRFRATLCLLWVTLNSVLGISYLVDGSMDLQLGKTVLCMVPFLAAGIVIGEAVVKRVNAKVFSVLVYACLFATGIFMLF